MGVLAVIGCHVMREGSLAVDISRFRNGESEQVSDCVAVEEPLEIRLGFSTPDGRGLRSLAVTMRTPGHDDELAVGFLLSESVISSGTDIAAIEACGRPDPDSGARNVIRVELAAHVELDLERLQRHFYTSSSCGVCGKTSIESLRAQNCGELPSGEPVVSRQVLEALPEMLERHQATFASTGGLHAAAAFTPNGELICVREDVGRHNAVDKLVGRLLLDDRLPAHDLGLLVSGRASFELVQKAVVAGMPLLAAVSAPSSLAVNLARDFGMTLVGFLRGPRFNIYTSPGRITV